MDLKLSLIVGSFLIVTIIFQTTAEEEEKKKLKLVLDKLEKIKDAEHILKTDLTFDKGDDGEVRISGQVEQSVDLDNEYKVSMDVLHSTEKDGDYKKVIGVAKLGVCTVMENQYKKMFYETLKNHSNAPDPDKCPVTKETYVVKDYPLDSSKFRSYLRPGWYKIISSLLHEGDEVLRYCVEAHTEEE